MAEQQGSSKELVLALRRCLWRYRVRELKALALEVVRGADGRGILGLLADRFRLRS
jgi:hypothetical protein